MNKKTLFITPIASIISVIIWITFTIVAKFQIGYLAIGFGCLIGLSTRFTLTTFDSRATVWSAGWTLISFVAAIRILYPFIGFHPLDIAFTMIAVFANIYITQSYKGWPYLEKEKDPFDELL